MNTRTQYRLGTILCWTGLLLMAGFVAYCFVEGPRQDAEKRARGVAVAPVGDTVVYSIVDDGPVDVSTFRMVAHTSPHEAVEAPLEVLVEVPDDSELLDCQNRVLALQMENSVLNARLQALQVDLIDAGAEIDTTVGRWAAMLRPEDRPSRRTVEIMTDYLRDYPVRLQVDEGLWIAERTLKDDWLEWGPSIDEVLIQYLGAARIAAEVPKDVLRKLGADWADEGYFVIVPEDPSYH